MPSKRRSFGQPQPLQQPFQTLIHAAAQPPAPDAQAKQPAPEPTPQSPAKYRGRVEIRRLKAGRGGKTVTEVGGFTGIGLPEKEALAKQMQKSCGAGGTVKEGRIEIQGDQRQEVARILIAAGFRPVFAGG